MLPRATGSFFVSGLFLASDLIVLKEASVTSCGTTGSVVGIGCVGEVFCAAFCGTRFSGIGKIGLPVRRSRMYTQLVLLASASAWRDWPLIFVSKRTTGVGAS